MASCIFCRIATGEVGAKVVYQDNKVVAFRDLNPQAPVHILVVPKLHIEKLSATNESDLSILTDVYRVVKKVVKDEKIEKDGFRVVVNDGKNGGQTVNHLHFHLLGGRPMNWPPG